VAESFELADQPPGVGGGVSPTFEPVGSEVLEHGVVVGEDVPDHHDEAVGAGEDRFALGLTAEAWRVQKVDSTPEQR
jgi:hypothetical protein